MRTNVSLTPEEVRVIGCLLEKAVTTPNQYPLTLSALTLACNQKSSREPVMSLDQGLVAGTARGLEQKHLISVNQGKNSVCKYSQRLCNTLLSNFQLSAPEYAVLCLLLLRGPQTPGELRARSGRLHAFADNEEVKAVLRAMLDREGGPMVARLPRRPGRMDHEYTHLFSGDLESVAEEENVAERSAAVTPQDSRIARLEARVAALERALLDLGARLGEQIDLRETEDDPQFGG